MADIIFQENCERLHAPLATMAANMLARLPGIHRIFLCDAVAPLPVCRGDDLVVLLERGRAERVVKVGVNRVQLTYADPASETALAALVAQAAPARTPIVLDPSSLATLALAERIARSDIPVLIEGPTGTGKEVISRFIHQSSGRAAAPFVAINCAAMPESMLEAMLFGHRRGAFTGASEGAEGFFRAADGGTLLLDEIAEMPLGLQAKLLRALQEGEVVPIGATKPVAVDVRVVACANRDLPREVAEGRFRADLYYRLNVFPLRLSALRERPLDIAPLAFAMLLRHRGEADTPQWITPAAIARLCQHAWPGNVRELENVMRRALVLAGGEQAIEPEHIVFDGAARALVPSASAVFEAQAIPAERHFSLSAIGRNSEAQAIAETLAEFGGNRVQTARKLGISERTLRYRLADMRSSAAVAGGAR